MQFAMPCSPQSRGAKVARCLAVLSLSTLVACSHLPQPPIDNQPSAIQNQAVIARNLTLKPVTQFSLEAKLAVQYAGKGYTARMTWAHQAQTDVMQIFSPLGQQVALIERFADGVQLTDQQGKRHQASDIGQLTEQLLGWRLPLSGLSAWVLGLPHAQTPHEALYWADGTPQQLWQDEWKIDYTDYQAATLPASSTQPLIETQFPHQLLLQHEGVRLKLVIQNWH